MAAFPIHGLKHPPRTEIYPGTEDSAPSLGAAKSLNYDIKFTNGKIGCALIISNEIFSDPSLNRKGAGTDSENLKKLFDSLYIDHKELENLNAIKIARGIEQFVAHASERNPSVVFLAITSHGLSDKILGVEYTEKNEDSISVVKIQKILNACGKLRDIPKVLILQACRGSESQIRDKVASPKGEIDPADFSVISRHTLIIYPTSVDYISWRSPKDGTWLIEQLCACVEKYKTVLHLTEILTICTYSILQNYRTKLRETQTCTYKSSLKKFLSFKDIEALAKGNV